MSGGSGGRHIHDWGAYINGVCEGYPALAFMANRYTIKVLGVVAQVVNYLSNEKRLVHIHSPKEKGDGTTGLTYDAAFTLEGLILVIKKQVPSSPTLSMEGSPLFI